MKYLITCCLFICFFLPESKTQSTKPMSFGDDNSIISSLEWRHIGPFRGGRSCAVTGVPGKPNLFYFGSTGGGVWRTTNGGHSYENLSDGYFGGSIGSVAVSESDHNVIYAGGGEKTVRGNVSSGYGIWKTEDAGKTWTFKGLKDSRHISRIRINPKDANIAYAAVMGNLYKDHSERGVFKTTDGGNTWKKVLYTGPSAGAVDLIIDPNNSRVLFATTWNIRRTPYSLESGGEESKLWKSTDSGETWKDISANKGLPEGLWGISAVAVSPVNSDRIWTIIENENGGVFRSDDGGETWQKTNSSRALRQRAWYYTRIYADTQDENIVYVVNVDYQRSKDGGKTFEAARAPHGDHHDLWIAPENNQRMIIGDDGGAQISYDAGGSWSTYHNQPTAQFYRVTTDNHFPYRIYVAQQDNSTLRISHRTNGGSIGEDDWERTAGGESAHIAVDPNDPDIVYGGSYGGFLIRMDHKKGTRRAINVWPDNPMGYGAEGMKYRFQWNFPIFFSKHNANVLYTTSNQLHKSTNGGQSWEFVSPDLTRNDTTKLGPSGGPITKDNTGVEYYCTIFAADESPLKEGLIWTGSDDGLIHITQDGGENWNNVTPSNMPEWMMINTIEPDPFNEGGCYVAGTKYKLGDFQPYLYKTENYGKTWRKIVTGIDREHFTRVIRADPNREGLLYAGTESGMYVSFNDGINWMPLQLNLPIVPITDLAIKNNNLIASTQGRSIWMIDDLTVLHQYDKNLANKDVHLFKPMDTYRFTGIQNKKVVNAGINHPSGVMVHYNLKDVSKEDSIVINITTNDGKLIQSYSTKSKEKNNKIDPKSGGNMFVWNMRYPDAKKFDDMIMWAGSLNGAKAIPGDYKVELVVNEKVETQDFTILPNPNSEITQQDYAAQFRFINEVNSKVTEAHQTIIDLREIKAQMKRYKNVVSENEEVLNAIIAVEEKLDVVEKSLYQTKNQSRQDPLNFPIRLTNKLAHLNSLTQYSDDPPTDQAMAVKQDLILKINDQIVDYQEILRSDIPSLNLMIKESQIDAIQIPKVDKP